MKSFKEKSEEEMKDKYKTVLERYKNFLMAKNNQDYEKKMI